MMEGFEIHCPNCGTLLRSKKRKGGAKPSEGCPDCGNKQAIFLPDKSYINEPIAKRLREQIMEADRCSRRIENIVKGSGSISRLREES